MDIENNLIFLNRIQQYPQYIEYTQQGSCL